MIKINKVRHKDNILYVVLFTITTVAYHVAYGLQSIIPTNIGWMMNVYHDWGQHYLGWSFYRADEWRFPFGDMYNFFYPVGTNVGFTDSIPLMAFICKLFSFMLPEDFQYFGFWLFLCMFLNGYFTIKILKLFNINSLIIILSCILLITNPVLIFRGMHPSLCAHWLILGSFYFYLKQTDKQNVIPNFKKQTLIFLLAATINPYFGFMIAGFVVILALKNYFFDKSLTIKQAFFLPIISIFGAVLFWIIFGMLKLGTSTNLDVGNIYGQLYSFNLNALFNSYGFYSKYIPQIGMLNDSQHEGFLYLGLGLITIVLISLFFLAYFIYVGKINRKQLFLLPLFLLCLIMLVFATSNIVTFGTKIIFEYPTFGIIQKLGSIFRATGRFAWPFYYLLIIMAIIVFSKIKLINSVKVLLLLALTSFQLYDIENLLTSRHLQNGSFDSKLDEVKWKLIIDNFDQVITYPPFGNNMVYTMDYQDLMYVALKSKKPISIGYVARENVVASQIFKDTLTNQLKRGEINENQLFVTNKQNIKDFNVLLYKDKVQIKKLDDYILIFSKKLKIKTEYKEVPENQKFTDSILSFYKKIITPKTLKAKYSSTDNIQFNVESFSNDDQVIQINGWAFAKTSTNNSKDSIFIGLTSKLNSTYIFPTTNTFRQDIADVYKNKFLINAGFKTTIFTDKIPKDFYSISIVIKDQKNKYHFNKTDKFSEIGKIKYKIPTISTAKFSSGDVMFNLEKIDQKQQFTSFSGWAAIKNESSVDKKLKIILTNQGKKFELETDCVRRNDVTMANKSAFNYDMCGFELKFKQSSIPKGTYEIGILIIDSKTNKIVFTDLQKTINF